MFTGLIEDVGTLVAREQSGESAKFAISTKLPIAEFAIGDSVAVNGACLTIESKDESGVLHFHTLSETLNRTNLGEIPLNSVVNLERAMRLDGRLGGHLVSGHVDAMAKVLSVTREKDDYVVTVSLPEAMAPLTIPKGSIAVNGVSLTIANLAADRFSVHVIPHTWKETNLASMKTGDPVNLEADLIGKYILRHQELIAGGNSVTMESLRDSGFLR
jgi:riboflavin synthase